MLGKGLGGSVHSGGVLPPHGDEPLRCGGGGSPDSIVNVFYHCSRQPFGENISHADFATGLDISPNELHEQRSWPADGVGCELIGNKGAYCMLSLMTAQVIC